MRDRWIKVRVSDHDKAKWTDASARAGQSLSDFVRQSIHLRTTGQTTDVSADLVALRRELAAIGNNLNQIAKYANQTAKAGSPDIGDIAAALDDLALLRRRLSRALRRP